LNTKYETFFYSIRECEGALEQNYLLAALLLPKKAKIMKEIQDNAKRVTYKGNLLYTNCFT